MPASISITWHTRHDNNVCPICREIDNYTWTFTVGGGGVPDFLEHPKYGVVWSVSQGSSAHSKAFHVMGCRCNIDWAISFGELVDQMRQLEEAIRTGTAEGDRLGEIELT